MIVVHKTDDSLRYAAKLAIKEHLYVPTWQLLPKLSSITKYGKNQFYDQYKAILFYYINERPIGLLLVAAYKNRHEFSFFVKPEHRRKKVATKLTEKAMESFPEIKDTLVELYQGDQGSLLFFGNMQENQKNQRFKIHEYSKKRG